MGHGPSFRSPGLQNCLEKWAKLRQGPFLCKLGIRPWARVTWYIGRKMGQNLILSEDLFFGFFALHLILSKKWDEIWVWQFQILIYVPLKFSEVSGPPPPFFKSCVRYWSESLTLSRPRAWIPTISDRPTVLQQEQLLWAQFQIKSTAATLSGTKKQKIPTITWLKPEASDEIATLKVQQAGRFGGWMFFSLCLQQVTTIGSLPACQ